MAGHQIWGLETAGEKAFQEVFWVEERQMSGRIVGWPGLGGGGTHILSPPEQPSSIAVAGQCYISSCPDLDHIHLQPGTGNHTGQSALQIYIVLYLPRHSKLIHCLPLPLIAKIVQVL